jgi:putative ABC transport system ATP-binding protein
VAIARALANDPALLLADEPTGNLDSKTGSMVVDLLAGLARERSRGVVIVTHDTRILDVADRVLYLADGALGPQPAD